jgi:hypothetical protein
MMKGINALCKILCKALSVLILLILGLTAPLHAFAGAPVVKEAIFGPDRYVNRTSEVWDAVIADAKNAGFTSITMTAAVRRNPDGTMTSYYSSTIPGTATGGSYDILGILLPILKKYNMHIRIGLFLDPDQWYHNSAPAADDAELTKKIVNDLWNRYWNYYQIIDGWYLPGEVNTNFAYGNNRVALANYYSDVVGYLHTHANNLSVMISPYFNVNAGQSPANWTSLWTYVLNAAPIDIIALQDGTGDSTWSLNQTQMDADLSTWFNATKTAIVQSSHPTTQLWDNLDLYKATDGGGAIDLDNLTLNIAATQASVSRYTSFGWFSCFSPADWGTAARRESFAQWNVGAQ